MFGAFKDEHLVLWCFAIYVAVFFTPGDLFYQLVNLKPIYVPIAVLKEIYRSVNKFKIWRSKIVNWAFPQQI